MTKLGCEKCLDPGEGCENCWPIDKLREEYMRLMKLNTSYYQDIKSLEWFSSLRRIIDGRLSTSEIEYIMAAGSGNIDKLK